MKTLIGVASLLIALTPCHGGRNLTISFPSYQAVQGGTSELHVNSTARFLEGIGAVRSIADVVLKILDLEAVRTSPKNWVVSPLSLAAIIAQLLLGSRGHLQSVLIDSLSLEKGVKPSSRLEVHRQLGRLMTYLQRSDTYTLDLNAAVFIQPGFILKPSYKHALLDFYKAQIYQVDFWTRSVDSTRKINDWIRQSTHGKLQEVFTEPLPSSTVSLMANVVYYNGRWESPFDPEFTIKGSFYVTPNEKVDVEYMFGEKELLYKNTTDMQLIGVPYKNWEVVLYILFPHETLNTSLSVERLDELISTASKENITLVMPKLKLLSTISVRQSVLKYLMKSKLLATRSVIIPNSVARSKRHRDWSAREQTTRRTISTSPRSFTTGEPPAQDSTFEEKFDIGGASEDQRFKFDDVIHQVSLEVDEKGSEIAGVVSTLTDYSAYNFLLKVNRPFWFFVRHEHTSAHLFWGRIVNPASHTN